MQRQLTIAIGLVLLTLVAFEPVRRAGFVNLDDIVFLVRNPHVNYGLSAEGLVWAFNVGHASNWHPLTWLSHMLDVSLWGLAPGPHHVTNVVLHAVSVVLLFRLLCRMSGETGKSAFVAAAFAFHPLQVESVAWVFERKDVLCALLGILTLWVWFDWTRRGGRARYIGALALFALGLAAKPMLVTLPFLLLLLDLWPLRRMAAGGRPMRALLAEKTPFFLLSGASCVLTLAAQSQGRSIASIDALPMTFRLANSACAYVAYIQKALWPVDLAVFYPYSMQQSVVKALACGAFVLGLSAVVLLQRRSRPWLAVGWFWFLGMLVPVIGIVQVGQQSMADRYMHLPIVGLAIAFAWGLEELFAGKTLARNMATAGAVVLAVCWAFLARAQAATWKDDFTLFRHAIAVTERNHLAHYRLGFALTEEGEFDEALNQFQLALEANPRYADAQHDIGRVLEKQGRIEAAVASYRKAVELDPWLRVARHHLARALDMTGRPDEAREQFEETLRLFPPDADLSFDYAICLLRQDRLAQAVEQLSQAIQLRPEFGEAYVLRGQLLADLGRLSEGIESVREGVRLLPDRADARAEFEKLLEEQAGAAEPAPR